MTAESLPRVDCFKDTRPLSDTVSSHGLEKHIPLGKGGRKHYGNGLEERF